MLEYLVKLGKMNKKELYPKVVDQIYNQIFLENMKILVQIQIPPELYYIIEWNNPISELRNRIKTLIWEQIQIQNGRQE